MKIKRHRRFHAEVATSSMNDIMFFLLLFFLIISTISNPNVIKILLPKSKAGQTVNKKQISLTVTADKQFFIDKRQIPEVNLEDELLAVTNGIEDPTVVLRVDAECKVQDMVSVLEIGAKLKIRMVMATKK